MKVIILNSRERLVPRVALEAKTLKDQGYNITIVNWCRSSKDFSYFSSNLSTTPDAPRNLALLDYLIPF